MKVFTASCVALVVWFASHAHAQTMQAPPVPLSSSLPPSEAVGGAVGTAGVAMRADAQIPRITRAAVAVTDASGNWTTTWATPLASTPLVLPIPIMSGGATQPINCAPVTISATAASGKCWTGQTALLNLSIITAGLTLNPNATAPAGISVQIFALPLTQ